MENNDMHEDTQITIDEDAFAQALGFEDFETMAESESGCYMNEKWLSGKSIAEAVGSSALTNGY